MPFVGGEELDGMKLLAVRGTFAVSAPADEFVEDFVGADRMIARLEWLEGLRAKGRKAS